MIDPEASDSDIDASVANAVAAALASAVLHRWFESSVDAWPDATAVAIGDQQLTYGELNARANQLAHRLIQAGVEPGAMVGIFLDRSLDMVVAMVGVLKAGAAYVPVDPDNPPSRSSFILSDARPSAVVTHKSLLDRLPCQDTAVLCVDDLNPEPDLSHVNPGVSVGPHSLAYVIYTSGSTGRPKGTLVSHHNVCRLFRTTAAWFQFGREDVWTVFHSFAFDFSVWELWGALLYGGKAVIVPGDVARAPQAFCDMLVREQVTVLCQTPSAFYPLMDVAVQPQAPAFPQLRFVIFGGEALDFRRLRPWFERHGDDTQLINMYGITETTVHTTYFRIRADALGEASVIGVPLPDLQIHLLDEDRRPVPDGEVGEIFVGGPGVALGYLNRADLTDERFISDPLGGEPGTKLYRSGDRARRRADGQLEFKGRADYQVKLRGYRIELGEIEAAIDRCPGVAQSVVVLQDAPSDDPELVAYIVGTQDAAPTPAELRTSLAGSLPSHMVPSAFVRLGTWPLTPNGKIDRGSLPPPRREHRTAAGIVAPRNDTEARVAQAWSEALSTTQIGVLDDYFELGGHSLMAARVCSTLRDTCRVPLTIGEVLTSKTVAQLAAVIDRMAASKTGVSEVPLRRHGAGVPLPTSFPQEAALFFEELAPGNLAYNNQVTVLLHGEIDVSALERTLTEVVRRHEILRTTFERVDGEWQQVIHAPWPVSVAVVDDAPDILQSIVSRRFQPHRLPLLSWTLVRRSPREHLLVHLEHHLIHDGWSFGVFMREFVAIYAAFSGGDPSPLPNLPYQFADFARWQRERLQGESLEASLGYWRSVLTGPLPILDLPTDRPRPPLQTFAGDEVQVDLSAAQARALKVFARATGSSLFSVMLAGFAALLHRYSGQDDLIIGAGFANRERREIEPLIGMIVNMLPLRIDAKGDPLFPEFVLRVQGVARAALVQQHMPFDVIVRSLDLPRDPSRNPLCQVAFSFHDSDVPEVDLPGLSGEVRYPHNASAKFDMNVIVIPAVDRITIKWDANTDLFDIATIRRMVDRYVRLLDAAVAQPQLRLSSVVSVDEPELTRLEHLNDTVTAYPRDATLAALFEEQAATRKSAQALVLGSRHVSYVELNGRANRLAHYLRKQGVEPETLVGLCLDRSIELVVALLAIVKAGAAYVPFDPLYPKARLDSMLRDSGISVLITDSQHVGSLSAEGMRTVLLDRDAALVAAESDANPAPAAGPGCLAYVIYTSGSTGTPKGVCVEQRGVVRLVKGADYIPFTSDATFLQAAPISFDASTFEIWGSLLNGARLAILPPGPPSLDGIARAIREHSVTTLWVTTALFNQMVDFELEALHGVPQILAGGEVMSVAHVRRLLAALPEGHVFLNCYGPTENTTFTTCQPLNRDSVIRHTVSIGRPISNTQVYILDEHLRPSPEGVPGELCIGGDGLARGYLNKPELTRDRFIDVDGRRLYRSGDRVRLLADGTIEFFGRADEQVKIRGFRIELGDVESALRDEPTVRECTVVVHAGASGDKQLCAYVVVNEKSVSDIPEKLRIHLRDRLPGYMVPAHFVTLDELPLTPAGKIDRRRLAARDPRQGERVRVPAPTRTAAEQQLFDIWSKHLRLDSFGIEDDFFELGGHSLLAAAVFAEIRRTFGVALPLATLFERPTIAGLATALSERQASQRTSNIIAVQPGGNRAPIIAMLGVGGNFVAYNTLSRALGPDQPFYSLEMPGMSGAGDVVDRVEDIAKQLQGEILAKGLRGPCVLFGACGGSLVVHELARRLVEAGVAVSLLVMADPAPTGARRSRRISSNWFWRKLVVPRLIAARIVGHGRALLRLRGAERAAYFKARMAVVREILVQRDLLRDSRVEVQTSRALEAASVALAAYEPKPYSGRVGLLLGDRYPLTGEDSPLADWQRLCSGPFSAAKVSGKDTGAMLREPHVAVLVARLKEMLESAR